MGNRVNLVAKLYQGQQREKYGFNDILCEVAKTQLRLRYLKQKKIPAGELYDKQQREIHSNQYLLKADPSCFHCQLISRNEVKCRASKQAATLRGKQGVFECTSLVTTGGIWANTLKILSVPGKAIKTGFNFLYFSKQNCTKKT